MTSFYVIIMIVMNQIGEILMSIRDNVIKLSEIFKNEFTSRLKVVEDLRQTRRASYADFQKYYDSWYCDDLSDLYDAWRERQDKAIAKKVSETGNEYTIEGFVWKVSFPGDNGMDTYGDLIDGLGHEYFPGFGDDFKLSDIVFSHQWSNLVKIYVTKTGDVEFDGFEKVLQFAIDKMTSDLDDCIFKLRSAVAIVTTEQLGLEEKCKKAMRPHYKKYHDELRRVVQGLYDGGKEDFAITLSDQIIWEDFKIWYNDATNHKRELDEVVKYLDLAKKVL